MPIERQVIPPWMDENGRETPPLSQEQIAESLGLPKDASWEAIKNKSNEIAGKPPQPKKKQ